MFFIVLFCFINSRRKGVAHRLSSLRNIFHATHLIYDYLIHLKNTTPLQLFSCELCKKFLEQLFYRTPGKSLILYLVCFYVMDSGICTGNPSAFIS